MARALDGSSYLRNGVSAPLTSAPVTLSVWCYCDGSDVGTALAVSDGTVSDSFFIDVFGGDLYAGAKSGTGPTENEAVGPASFSTLQWRHFAVVMASTSSAFAFIDGVKGAEATSTSVPLNLDEVAAGTNGSGGNNLSAGTRVAEAAVWNVALTDGQVSELAAGAEASNVNSAALVFYAPILGVDSPEPDLTAGNRDLTITGTATQADHPPIVYASAASAGLLLGIG